jgi:hypothetical protein
LPSFSNPLQLCRQIPCRTAAIVGILRETSGQQPIECSLSDDGQRGSRVGKRRERRRRGADDGRDDRRLTLPIERASAGEHLVQQHAEGVNIRTCVHLAALELLGRHVMERAEDRALTRERLCARDAVAEQTRAVGRGKLGQAEVQELRARLGQHHVAGLQVAMDDAAAMGGVERQRDLVCVRQRRVDRNRAA